MACVALSRNPEGKIGLGLGKLTLSYPSASENPTELKEMLSIAN